MKYFLKCSVSELSTRCAFATSVNLHGINCLIMITLHAKLSGEVYCYQSCLLPAGGVCLCVCLWVCYHDNSKLRASIFTKLGL